MTTQLPPFSPETHNVTAYTALLKVAYQHDDAMQALSSQAHRAGNSSASDFYGRAASHAFDRVNTIQSLITTVKASTTDEAAVQTALLFGMFNILMDQVPEDAETYSFKREVAAIERLIFSIMDFLESQSARPLKEQVNDYFGSPWCSPWQEVCPPCISEVAE